MPRRVRGRGPAARAAPGHLEDLPSFVAEVTSRPTRATDLGAKRGLYEQLGVRELVLFDPLGEYLRPRLRMWRLAGDAYVEVAAAPLGRWSEVLGLWLDPDPDRPHRIRLREEDGTLVLHPEEWAEWAEEEAARAEAEAARAEAEAARARRAEAERDRLRAELERIRREDR